MATATADGTAVVVIMRVCIELIDQAIPPSISLLTRSSHNAPMATIVAKKNHVRSVSKIEAKRFCTSSA